MSKHYFTLAEFRQRQAAVRAEMARQGLDVLVVINPVNINYLIGAAPKSYQVFECVFFPLEDRPIIYTLRLGDVAEVTDYSLADTVRGWGGVKYEDPIDVFTEILVAQGYIDQRIGIEFPDYYLSVRNYQKIMKVLDGKRFVDASSLIENIKLIKSPAEIALIRKAAAIADIGIESLRNTLRPGITERQAAAEAHKDMMAAGGESPASPMNFASGERTCYAHVMPSDRVLQPGDFMHIEFGGQFNKYVSTIARHFSLGEPSQRALQLHEITHEANQACIDMIREGVRAEDVYKKALAVIGRCGLAQYNLHVTGYGIAPGFPPSWGESISLFDKSEGILRAGMVVSIEPPIFIHEERVGARIIDCVIVHKDRAEVLSTIPEDLIRIP
ncbi:aminopeptidase P family protein [Verticiella sediminum]|uniref:Aminopeptidase P family protein n=1 Tax=Verticiella sediminum TaxID=1247510 RepID=A0A556AQ05_9BURK|nr:Xaa-Pro peptidase family protein [Verticiella sediminum]TSH94981.1 aminopeptidase P family protein [Verticiella sediminum]